jgi:hypothetical protein
MTYECILAYQEPVIRYELKRSEAEQSLENQIKEKEVLEQVGSQESNTILCASCSLITMSKEIDTNI